jgi:hypothetical protein
MDKICSFPTDLSPPRPVSCQDFGTYCADIARIIGALQLSS